jgi:AraC family transcriptional regulator
MTPIIRKSKAIHLVGIRMKMNLVNFQVQELWTRFMLRRKEIKNCVNDDLVSMTDYKKDHFVNFHPTNFFDKWAAIEVIDFNSAPMDMETFTIPEGLYAVFNYMGLHSDQAIYQYIFGTWLPGSTYEPDNRPHFEILGPKYKNNDPDSEEEIWIPIKPRK